MKPALRKYGKQILKNIVLVVTYGVLLMLVAFSGYLFSHFNVIIANEARQAETLERVEMGIELNDTMSALLYDTIYNTQDGPISDFDSLDQWFLDKKGYYPKYDNYAIYHMGDNKFIDKKGEFNKSLIESGFINEKGEKLSLESAVWNLNEITSDKYYVKHNGEYYLACWTYAPNNKYDFHGKPYDAERDGVEGFFIVNLRSVDEVVNEVEAMQRTIDLFKITKIGRASCRERVSSPV